MLTASSPWIDARREGAASNPAAALHLEPGARVLVLTGARRAPSMRRQIRDATILTDAASLEGLEAQFDAAVIDGLLQDEPWDRWVLQRVHRLLRMDAQIVVAVPPLISLASATDLRFLAYASRQVLMRLVRRWRPKFELTGAVHRRYHFSLLMRKMESVGFTAIQARPGGLTTARKTSSLSGVRGRSWPSAEVHRKRYAERYAPIPVARDAWLSSFPEFRAVTPRALEPSEWHDARVLVLAPHPDDELIGCGGTLCRLLSSGAKAWILQATDGCKLESLRDLPEARRKTVRLEEAQRVSSALGAGLVLWRQEDQGLRCSGETTAKLAGLLGELHPTHVFTPFLGDTHADHRTLSYILGGALGAAGLAPQVLQYEVWGLVPANLYCDITDRAETLENLLLLYERAMRVEDFVHFCESRNLARALELTGQPGYAEAFLCTTSDTYRRLVERSRRRVETGE
jgi:LmbE family N-acetylglucosaminyl deacetylase